MSPDSKSFSKAGSTADLASRHLDKFSVQEGGEHHEFRLSSHFQPIYSLAHRRPVGFEGLIRAIDSNGRKVPPVEL